VFHHNGRVRIVARCVRGLEPIVAAEARGRLGARIQRVRHREVWLEGSGPASRWLGLRTADDVFVRIGVAPGISHVRASLSTLGKAAASVDWSSAIAAAARPAGPFDVVASFLGRRNYNRFEVEAAVGGRVAEATGRHQVTRGHDRRPSTGTTTTIRVHVEGDDAVFGVRIGDEPLHRRGWKQDDQLGTLHPPVAAAVALMTGLRDDLMLWDVFCGAGTIAIEALNDEPRVTAVVSDLSPTATRATTRNARRAGVSDRLSVVQADAGALPVLPGGLFRVAGNAPWGRALQPAGRLAAGGVDGLVGELARALGVEGRACLLVGDDSASPLVAAAGRAGLEVGGIVNVAVAGARSAMVVVTRAASELIDVKARFGRELADEFASAGAGV
jgi:tRNA (guanine6-N2)-methyltransferase